MNNNISSDNTPWIYHDSTRQKALISIGSLIGCWYGCSVATFPCSSVVYGLAGIAVGDSIYSLSTPNRVVVSQPSDSRSRVGCYATTTQGMQPTNNVDTSTTTTKIKIRNKSA